MRKLVLMCASSLAVSTGGAAMADEYFNFEDNAAAERCADAAMVESSDVTALKECDQAIEHGDAMTRADLAATHVNRAILRMVRENYAGASLDLDRAQALSPNLGEAYLNRGSLLLRQGRYGEAIEALDRGLALNTSSPATAYYSRGLANEHIGQTAQAYYDYQRAAELAPDWQRPRAQLTRFQVRSAS